MRLKENEFFSQVVGNAHFSVDTFFFMGAFLLVYMFLEIEKKSKDTRDTKFYFLGQSGKLLVIIIYRFIRLTPAYMFVLFLTRFTMS